MNTILMKEVFSFENMIKKPLPLIRNGILNDFERQNIITPQTKIVFHLNDTINCCYAKYVGLNLHQDKDHLPEKIVIDSEFAPWKILSNLVNQIKIDFTLLNTKGLLKPVINEQLSNAIIIGNPDLIKVMGTKVVIHKGVVLDTTAGPIILGNSVRIYPFSTIEGPVYIGENTEVKSARISGGVLIGHTCKISGEICNSVMGDYSNKTHEGLIANSYVGDWCNIGGYSNTACLKTDYSEIQVKYRSTTYETGTNKFGAIIGNFVRIGGGITLMPGTCIDTCTTIVQLPVLKGYIKPFTRVTTGLKFSVKDFAVEMQAMMDRRQVKINEELLLYWQSIYDESVN
ncbi:hypothetical protein GNY06_10325 [Elizabethkingia argentiflava]|uniref:Glucose-1-phosphate thymidylyltransferase n=1 Tax=Elizabethkingia argenteiflava TaxID=2681556 RepID=A0A845PU48_9FLAO|nr:hypothetical protein [Elizabethkingia argenteiflava]NAW51752.1 hypothetical protein [Elizabethkingia argenteiflava]